MKTYLTLSFLFFYVHFVHAQEWEVFNLPDYSGTLFDVKVTSDTSAIASGNGVVFLWDGTSWTRIDIPSSPILNALHFLNPQHGFAAGGLFQNRSIILETEDGGSNWNEVFSGGRDIFLGLHFPLLVEDTLGYGLAYGFNGALARTTDSGTSWTDVTGPIGETLIGGTSRIGEENDLRTWVVGEAGSIYNRIGRREAGGELYLPTLDAPGKRYPGMAHVGFLPGRQSRDRRGE